MICFQVGVIYYIEWDNCWFIVFFDWSIFFNGIGECGLGGDLFVFWMVNDVGSGVNDFGFDNGVFIVINGGSNGYSNSNDNIVFVS